MSYERSRQEREPAKKKKRSFLKTLLMFFFFIFFSAGAFIAIAVTLLLHQIKDEIPPIEEILRYQPNLTSIVYDRNQREIARLFQENRTWVPLKDISPWLIKAVLAAEDGNFYEHPGIRVSSIIRAAWVDFTKKGVRQGGSTITQQLARNLFLTREQTIKRKAREALLSIRLENIYTKDQILEMYLNTFYLGHGNYGIGAAAQGYFGKQADALTLPEASMIAGLIAAPEAYTPLRHPKAAKTRQTYVLRRMVDLDMISYQEGQDAVNTELVYRKQQKRATFQIKDAPYFVSHILFKHLLPQYGADTVYRGGLRIRTTIDLDLQQKAEEVVSKLPYEGALVALDPNTGEILALVGGRNFDQSKFNRATQAFRQPGSAFKPIVYATAMENGYRPIDRMLDAPLNFANGWSPKNSNMKYAGEVTLIQALAQSINTIVVRLAQVVGITNVKTVAQKMGISTPYMPDDLSLALGTASVTPLEMAVAYSCFANNGEQVKPYGILEITDSNGKVLEQNGPELVRAITPETAVTIRSMLTQAVNWGTGTRARVKDYQTFGKTGTTNDWTDAWFAGGVPGLVTVVYIGNDNHTKLGNRIFGSTMAAPAWNSFVTEAVKKLGTPKTFTIPPETRVESVRVCRQTGFKASGSCPSVEIFLPVGQAPDAVCPWHGGSREVALADPNAPQLILAPDDDAARGTYALRPVAPQTESSGDQKTTEEVPVKRPTVQDATPPKPNETPYKFDPTPAAEIEKKYQDLLKKYNIND